MLFLKNPRVHIDVAFSKPKLEVENDCVTIVGVYANLFRIEENISGRPQYHSIRYADVIAGHIKIRELII